MEGVYPRDLAPALGPQAPSHSLIWSCPQSLDASLSMERTVIIPSWCAHHLGKWKQDEGLAVLHWLKHQTKTCCRLVLILFFLAFGCNLLPNIFQVHDPRVRAWNACPDSFFWLFNERAPGIFKSVEIISELFISAVLSSDPYPLSLPSVKVRMHACACLQV